MKSKLIRTIKDLKPSILQVKELKIKSFKKLGIGEGNLNYVFQVDNKRFICRVNIDPQSPKKTIREFKILRLIENTNLAPKTFYLHKPDHTFPYGFVILEFVDGKPLRTKKDYSIKEIKELAVTLAKIHNIKLPEKPRKYSYNYYLKEAKEYISRIKGFTNKIGDSGLIRDLRSINKKIKTVIPKKEIHDFGLIHGDVNPKNTIRTKDGLRLIDWESSCYSDPAKDIANIIVDFKMNDKNISSFIKEYGKYRHDKEILKRARVYAILLRYNYFLWEIVRTFEIINKELPKEYIRKTSYEEHLREAKYQLKELKKTIFLPDINIIDTVISLIQ